MKLLILSLLIMMVNAQKNAPSVIIIGAGPAGLAAGRRLYENGFDVTILEANNRIGGRIHSVKFGDAYVDLGAEWCHGEEDNIVYQMVNNLNVLRHSYYDYHLYYSDRKYISNEFNKELEEMFDTIYSNDGDRNQPIDLSVGEYCLRLFNQTIRERWGNDREKFIRAMASIETFHRYVLSDEGSFTWFDSSATNGYRDCKGDLELNWNGRGYRTILEVILKRFPRVDRNFRLNERIKLGKEVVEVVYKEDFAVALCKDGSGYMADHIIFTPSLGVLKHQHKTLFNPPLGPGKVQVIDELGIAGVTKVILLFPNRWWPTGNFTGWTLAWTFEDREMLPAEFPYGPIRYEQHWLRDIMCIYRLEKNPRALSLWFTGEYVPDIELMDEDVLIQGIMYMLEKFFGDVYTISYPEKLIRGDWISNPLFRGTYSYQTVTAIKNFKAQPNLVLAEPIVNRKGVPRLQFAGEATHPYYYSTVHGAIETGFREADRLIKLY